MIYISELVSSKSKFIAPPPHTRIYMAASSCLLRRQGDIIKTPRTKMIFSRVLFNLSFSAGQMNIYLFNKGEV